MSIKAASVGLVAAGFCFAGNVLAAQPPAICNSPRELRGFDAGVNLGTFLVEQGWNAVDDCDLMEDFANIVMNSVDSIGFPQESSVYVMCRVSGFVQGIEEEVHRTWNQCAWECGHEGRFVGQIGGKLYCDWSIALGGLPLADDIFRYPVRTCGAIFQIGCDSEFMGFTQMGYPGCSKYTGGEFRLVWDQARNNECVYNPTP